MKFFYLYLVGLLNLALGWGAARWLTRTASVADDAEGTGEGDPAADRDPVPDNEPAPTEPVADSDPVPDDPVAEGKPTSVDTEASPPAEDPKDSAEDQLEAVEVAAASDDEPTEGNDAEEVDDQQESAAESLEQLIKELGKQAQQFAKTGESLTEDDREPHEMQATASAVDQTVKKLLTQLNGTVDLLADSTSEKLSMGVEQVESCWENVNAEAVQLVTLDFEGDNLETSKLKLVAICSELGRVCRESQEALGNLLECAELEENE